MAVFFLASTAYLQAQEVVHTGSLTITSNTDPDLPSNVEAITQITGTLRIGGTFTDFPKFAALRVVTGNLQILRHDTPSLTELTGIFPALTEVRNGISINLNPQLTSVSGFDALETITNKLTIFNNAALTTISGFGALTSVGSIDISSNSQLSSCCALFRIANGPATPQDRRRLRLMPPNVIVRQQ